MVGRGKQERPSVALIAEDDDSIRRLLEEVLRLRGYRTIGLGGGSNVHARARGSRPDVIVLDVGLPGLDGFEVLARLKGDPDVRDIPVLLMTGRETEEIEERAREAGAYGALRKPFDIHALGDLVDEAVIATRRGQTSDSSKRSMPATGIDTHSGRLSSS